jgi:nucleoside-diphosphate-sugar epimerase
VEALVAMQSLVTGASGFLGLHLVRALHARGERVTGYARSRPSPAELPEGVDFVLGDVNDAAALARAVREARVVYHLAGIRRTPHRRDFFRVNAEGTRSVCEALCARGGRARLVLCGSLSALGPSTVTRPLREDDPFSPAEAYGESKAEAERIARTYEGRLEVVIARPVRIVGPGDRENLAFFKLVKKGLLLSLGGGPRPLSLVDVDDVVEALLLMGTRPEAVGQTFFVASRETSTLEGIQALAAQALGVSPRKVVVPAPVFRALAHAADLVSTLTRRHLPLNAKLARQMLAPAWTCETAKAQSLLGFSAKVGVAESVARSARWYVDKGWL